jgi:hypothetical protein
MRNYKNTKEVKEVVMSQLVSITCDVCKKTYAVDNYIESQEFVPIRFTGGYGSIFGDELSYECDICQHCAKTLFGPYLRLIDDQGETVIEEE